MSIARIGKHLLHHHWWKKKYFSAEGAGCDRGERSRPGKVRPFRPGPLCGGRRARRRAAVPRSAGAGARAGYFFKLRIWDTAHNNGVLIYLLLADRDVEIVADRGIDAKVGAAGWEKICTAMEAEFKAGKFRGGVIKGIEAVSQQLAAHFPKQGAGRNELPDAPVVI